MQAVCFDIPLGVGHISNIPKRVTPSATFYVPYTTENVVDVVGDDLGSWEMSYLESYLCASQ